MSTAPLPSVGNMLMNAGLFGCSRTRSLLLFAVIVLVALGLTVVPDLGGRAVADPGVSTEGALSGVTAVDSGGAHTCAVMIGGTVKCWGLNDYGQLGDGTTTNRTTPVDVFGLFDVIAIATGWAHSCALTTGGTVRCWGYNSAGQLGDGTTTNRTTSVDVAELSGATAIATGPAWTCALLPGGRAKCWGYNPLGQLGDGTDSEYRSTPVDVAGLSGATSIAAGGAQTCAVMSGGTAQCWGSRSGLSGPGPDFPGPSPIPLQVAGLSGATDISVGDSAGVACALMAGGTAQCWGANSFGQLGDGTTTQRFTPAPVYELSGAIDIETSGSHTCALMHDSTMQCWGSNFNGQLGQDYITPPNSPFRESYPEAVIVREHDNAEPSNLSGVKAITVGWSQTCALMRGGTVKCWGGNSNGQLGDGTTTDQPKPSNVVLARRNDDLCKSINYLGVRGSSEAPQGPLPSTSTYPLDTVDSGMGKPIDAQYSSLRSILQRMGKADDLRGAGIVYSAIPVQDYAANSDAYLKSLQEGASKLRAELSEINDDCKGKATKIILAGYSQGADVINTAAAAVQRENDTDDFKNVVSIVYYGNPSRIGGQLPELIDTTGTGARRIAGAAVEPATDTWINNGNNKSLFTSICADVDLVCDTSDNLKMGATLVVSLGGGALAPLGAAQATEIGYKQHTNYQTTSMNCAIPGIGVRRVTTTTCGATAIIGKLGYAVPADTFDEYGGWQWHEFKPGDLGTGILTGAAGMTYNLSIESDPIHLGTVVADDNGLAAFEFTIPGALAKGDHHLVATNSANQRFTVPIRVSATAPDQPDSVIVISENDATTGAPTEPETPGGTGSAGSSGFGS